jgi:hypothetical protein
VAHAIVWYGPKVSDKGKQPHFDDGSLPWNIILYVANHEPSISVNCEPHNMVCTYPCASFPFTFGINPPFFRDLRETHGSTPFGIRLCGPCEWKGPCLHQQVALRVAILVRFPSYRNHNLLLSISFCGDVGWKNTQFLHCT